MTGEKQTSLSINIWNGVFGALSSSRSSSFVMCRLGMIGFAFGSLIFCPHTPLQ